MFRGIPVSNGVAIGKSYLLDRSKFCLLKSTLEQSDIENEIQRFREAIENTKIQMQEIKKRARRVADKYAVILDTYTLLLEDDILVSDTIENIKSEKMNAEWALTKTLEKFTKLFNNINDDYLKGKQDDLELVVHGIIRNLIGHTQDSLSDINEPVVLVAHTLSPSDTLLMPRNYILGLATEAGGKTSHVGIFASTLGIPAVVGIKGLFSRVNSGDPIIVDGIDGNVIVKPDEKNLEQYEKKKEKLEKIFVGIGTHRQTIEDTDKKLKSVNSNIESFSNSNKKLRKLGNLRGKLSQKVSTITKEHKFFKDNTECPTCTQSIEESFRLNKIDEAKSKADELKKGYEELEQAIKLEEEREQTFKKLSSEATKLTHEISKTNTRISGLENQSRDLEQEIQTITEQLKNRTAEKHALETLLSQLEDLQKEQSEFKEKNAYHEFAHSLMKDGGVKSKIIRRYLPLMNQQINKYLQLMDFYINFSLDEEFKESIKSPVHEDFSYESFSEGEKMRIDLSLLFTWRDIAKMKNSVSTNLLILDEIFDSSLDGFGTDYFTRIIKYVVTDANVFVISHKTDDLVDKFDNILKFDKVKGFSKIVQ